MVTGMITTGLGAASMILGAALVLTAPTGCTAANAADCDDPHTYGFVSYTAGLAVGLAGGAMWFKGAAPASDEQQAESRRRWVALGPSGVALGGQF